MLYLQKSALMRIDIITVLPEMLEGPLGCSIVKRARDKQIVEIVIHNLRDFSLDKHRKVDDYAYSKGAGMVMTIPRSRQPLTS